MLRAARVEREDAAAFNVSNTPSCELPLEALQHGLSHRLHALSSPKRVKPLIWIHLHKAAGTFMCAMAQLANESVVKPSDNCNWLPHDDFKQSDDFRIHPSCHFRYQYFKKHGYTYGQLEREVKDTDLCWETFDYGVMLREPIAYMRSVLNFAGRRFKDSTYITTKVDQFRREYELEANSTQLRTDAADSKRVKTSRFLDNMQTRLLANAIDVPAGKISKEHVALARKRIRQMRAVFRVEDLGSHSEQLFRELGWQFVSVPTDGQKINACDQSYDFTPEQEKWLRQVNEHDIAIYESIKS